MNDPIDHRSLGERLDLFHFQEQAPGMVFWHPRGFALYRLLEEAARQQLVAQGYKELKTPQLLREAVWQASGHAEHFRDGMFHLADQSMPAALKPVSCPGHIYVAMNRRPSYRELPLRLAEFGVVHRDEPSGTLHGLLRLRQFTQDDGHVFASYEQATHEVERFCRALPGFYAAFGFEQVAIAFSTRPAERAGTDDAWDRAESALESALARIGCAYTLQPGAGAFYGPKIEFSLRDKLGRDWQCGTIQLDLVMPERFDLRYVDAHGERPHVVMLHRALYGSLERFLGMLLEHYGARLPAWLAPRQILVLPVSDEQADFARDVAALLTGSGLRAELDARSLSLSKRVAEAKSSAVPFLAVVGESERAARSVSLQSRDARESIPLDALAAELGARCKPPVFASGVGSAPCPV